MNYLDIIIAIILLLFGVKGFRKGLIIEVVTLLAFAVGIYGAMHFSDFTAEHLKEFMEINPKYLNTTAFVLTFILLVILVNIIGRMVTKLIQAMNLGFFNKLGGAVFGMAKGVLLCSIMVMVLNNFQLIGIVKPEVREQSKLYPYIEETVPYVYRGFDLVKGYVDDLQNEEEEPSQAPLQTV
ncbi:MAG: CvpA family protein [Bacteroidales bacterium]|nr:CvpA family protein [Bacteroidales bacterium]MBR4469678.1 CvpA family protein [Bacteroidales bacterium]MBR6227129.1 CvpA family protein [Bacteroidales bacterium]